MMLIRASLLILILWCNTSHAGLFGNDEELEALRKQVSAMEARIAKMEQVLNNQGLIDLYSKVETLSIELNKFNGQIETLNNENSLLQKRQKDFYIDLDNRLRSIEESGAKPATPSSTGKDSRRSQIESSPEESVTAISALSPSAHIDEIEGASVDLSEPSIPSSNAINKPIAANELIAPTAVENGAYKQAYGMFKNGDYTNAIKRFENFLIDYPNSSLAPGAAYWIGNARYALRDYQLAIDAQKKLISTYPDSLKTPDAFLNIASSQQELGDRKASQHTLEDLIAKFPQSDAAKKAKQRLAHIK